MRSLENPIQIEVVAVFLMFFGARMHIMLLINVNILVFVNWSYRFSQLH